MSTSNMLLIIAYFHLFSLMVESKFVPTENFQQCFGVFCQNNGTLDYDTCFCDCPPGKTGVECDFEFDSEWPDDDFALPETIFGCPEPDLHSWRLVEINLSVKEYFKRKKRQYFPELPHYRGPFHSRNMSLNFCVKQRQKGEENADAWPVGNYCLYKQHPCPQGMEEDEIFLRGYFITYTSASLDLVPFIKSHDNGHSSTFVKLSVCCKLSNETVIVTTLPRSKPFMLLQASNGECQHVEGAEVKQEWFAFVPNHIRNDTNEGPLSLQHGQEVLNLTYCYYRNYERQECLYMTDSGSSYRGRLNYTNNGRPCSHWSDISGIEYSNILENNYCRKVSKKFRSLSCFAKVDEQEMILNCKLKKCYKETDRDYLYRKYHNIAYNRPVLTNIIKTDLRGLVNGLSWGGSADPYDGNFIHKSITQRAHQPWVRIDLGAIHRIYGIILYRKRNRCVYPNKWFNIATWIHMRPYHFKNFGANLCWEIEDLLDVCNIEMRCVQPLTGYYVTIQAFASALLEYKQPDGVLTSFEEIEVYGEATRCGQYFGIGTGRLWRFQVDSSLNRMTSFYLVDDKKSGERTDVVLKLDLLSITTIEGIALSFTTNRYLKVKVRHGIHGITNSSEAETMVLYIKNGHDEELVIRYFREKIIARFLELSFINANETRNIYVRYDLIGCPKIFVRDPTCQRKDTIVGMSEENGTTIIGIYTKTLKPASNASECSQLCLETEDCLQWSFSLEERSRMCATKQSYLIKESRVMISGEKICLEDKKVATPCHFEMSFTDPLYINSLNYPESHPSNMKCSWKINFNESKAIKITYLTMEIPPQNNNEDLNSIENCVDFLSLGELEHNMTARPHIILTSENASSFERTVTFLQKESYLYINFITCMRPQIIDPPTGFSLKIEESDCEGCKNEPTTCTELDFAENTVCRMNYDCGYLSSLNYLGKYHNNMMCRWSFVIKSVAKIEFIHFDIPGGIDCSGDSLTIYNGLSKYFPDFSNKDDWSVIGVYCNANRPRAVSYIETNFIVEFATGDNITGTGFLLKWHQKKDDRQRASFRKANMERDWEHVLAAYGLDAEKYRKSISKNKNFQYCGKPKHNFEFLLEYPFKCYLRVDDFINSNEPVSWNEASVKCNQVGGELIAISNRVEEAIVMYYTDDVVVNNVFIGLYRNHSSGQLYDTVGNKYIYMKWGFDNDLMSVEPNGFDLSNCLMLRDLLVSSGSSSDSKWADVNCDEQIIALVICERPIRMPWNYTYVRYRYGDMSRNLTNMQNNSNNLFMCRNGEYIRHELKCDKENNCLDGSDEIGCDYTACLSDKFYCGEDEPRCININLTCDSYTDCHNGADEINCVYPECDFEEWMCLNGQCIPISAKNNGVFDCMDKSDEIVEGFKWRIDIETSDTSGEQFAAPSDNYVQIYSENGRSENIYLKKNSYVTSGSIISIERILNMSNPFKIRVTHYAANENHRWYLERITLYNNVNETFKFDCNCIVPDPNYDWIPFRDISVSNQETGEPVSDMVTYTITVKTGKEFESGTANKVFITLFGEESDTGIIELKYPFGNFDRPFQSGSVDVFTYETVDIGDIAMVKVYHYGPNIRDTWFVEQIRIRNAQSNDTIKVAKKKLIQNMVADLYIGLSLPVGNRLTPDYVDKRSCSENMFQCLDGSCIRTNLSCDQTVHCHGPFHEDEPMACSPRHLRRSCLQMLVYTNSKEDFFPILLRGSDEPSDIHCAYGEGVNTGKVISKVHSNFDHWVNVTIENINITYSISDAGIFYLKRSSEYCSQRIEVECQYSIEDDLDQAVKFTDNKGNFFEPFKMGGKYCKKKDKDKQCKCMKARLEWNALRYNEFLKEREIVVKKYQMIPIRKAALSLRREQPTEIRVRLSPLECFESISLENRLICKNAERYEANYQCIFERDNNGDLKGCRDFSHLTDCDTFKCPFGYVKCNSGFCIPLHYLCNGVPECLGQEDERDCNGNNTCFGALRCRNSTICVASNNLCDGSSDCPFNDDELLCRNSTTIIRSLNVEESLKWDNHTFNEYAVLATLNLSSKGIETIGKYLFEGLMNLLVLDLSFNKLTDLSVNLFTDLKRLKKIDLQGNPDINLIDQGTFNGLSSLEKLELKDMKISIINTGTFEGLDLLKTLNLSNNHITTLNDKAFDGLSNLKILDLRGNDINEFTKDVFYGLHSLKTLYSDLYLLCCIKPYSVQDDQCFPTRNEFSSCDDLMRNEVLRAFVWIIGLIALSGNALALVYRFMQEKASFKTGNGILLTNLCVADFLMGVYMIIIGSADSHFRGKYVWNDISWRNGVTCKLAGFLSFLSCEVSGFFLCLITIDRYVTIRFTLKRMGFTRRSAFLSCLFFWGISIILAVLPLVGIPYFDKRFYTRSGVCLAHPLTTDKRGGWEYATAIFVFLNFFMFIFIAVGQFLIFREIRKVRIVIQGQQRDDVAIARKLSLVVMTNFLCWFPICIMGLIAMSNIVIDIEVYAWVAVFVLPLNSATNPIVYTLSSLFTSSIGNKIKNKLAQDKNKGLTEDDEAKKLQDLYDQGMILLCKQQNSITLSKYLDNFTLKPSDAAAMTRKLAETLYFVHMLGFVVGPLTCDEVILNLTRTGIIRRVSLIALPIYSDIIDDVSSDIGNLGLVIKKMVGGHKSIYYVQKSNKIKLQRSFKEKVFKLFGSSISEGI